MTDMPTSWQLLPLGALLELLLDHRGKTPGKLGGEFVASGVPAISAIHIKNGHIDLSRRERYVSDEMFQRWMPERLRRGDVLMTSEAPLGSLALVPSDDPLVLSQRLFALRSRDDLLDNRYLRWFLEAPAGRQQLDERSSGTTVTGIRQAELRQVRIPIPPLEEQHRIVDLLEDHLSRLDAAEQSVRRSLGRLVSLRDAALSQAVEFAFASSDVKIETIGDLAKVSSGLTPLKGNKAFYEGGTIPWITSGDLHQGLITEAKHFVTQAALDKTTLKLVPAGSILIAMYGEGKTRGTAAELGLDATTNQACAAVQLHDSELRPWVRLVLEANYSKLRRLAAGGVQPNLNQAMVKAIEIPIPVPDVRSELLAQRAEFDDVRSRLQTQLVAAQLRGARLRRSLLAAAFSGRLTGDREFAGA